MPQRTISPASTRPARRHERRDGHDIADIYEARLLANGLRSDDFVALRSSTDLPRLPDLTPVRFGRGATDSLLPAIAVIEMRAETDTESEPDPESGSEPDSVSSVS